MVGVALAARTAGVGSHRCVLRSGRGVGRGCRPGVRRASPETPRTANSGHQARLYIFSCLFERQGDRGRGSRQVETDLHLLVHSQSACKGPARSLALDPSVLWVPGTHPLLPSRVCVTRTPEAGAEPVDLDAGVGVLTPGQHPPGGRAVLPSGGEPGQAVGPLAFLAATFSCASSPPHSGHQPHGPASAPPPASRCPL